MQNDLLTEEYDEKLSSIEIKVHAWSLQKRMMVKSS